MKPGSILCAVLISLCLSQVNAQPVLPESYTYIFPQADSRFVDRNTTILIRLKNISPFLIANLESFISVIGDKSGNHRGRTIIASDNRTIIFKAKRSFTSGENVRVRIDPYFSASNIKRAGFFEYKFSIIDSGNIRPVSGNEKKPEKPQDNISKSGPLIKSNGVAVPSDFPHLNITERLNPSEDFIYMISGTIPTYKIIFNTLAEPVWYEKTNDKWGDFTLQPNGYITMFKSDIDGSGTSAFAAYDEDFQFIKYMSAVNGYKTDEHDFYMFSDGGYILIGKKSSIVDMSQYVEGGKPDAEVLESCIQEFTSDGQLIYIWRSWDHFDIRDLELDNLSGSSIRFPHINAIWEDSDGNILISSRHLSEISKIDRSSGDFIWRLSGIPGSPNNDFEFINDPLNGFRNQHAIQLSGDNRYSLFDNGNLHPDPRSRAVEYQLDTEAMTATLVWEYRNNIGNGYTNHLGNAQALSNGNMHINWALGSSFPVVSEISQAGEPALEMWFANGERSYRSLRHPWNGVCSVPKLILEPNVYGVSLIFNKFGDTNIDYYKIYGGTRPEALSIIDTSASALKHLNNLQNGTQYYFRVTAVDKQGNESDFSNEESILINNIEQGANLIKNGDFNAGQDYWEYVVSDNGSADLDFTNGICSLLIENGGSNFNSVSLQQSDIPLFRGQTYLLEYDARSDATKYIEVLLCSGDSPEKDYSRIGYSSLGIDSKRYSYTFKMEDPTDFNALFVIKAGNSAEDVIIDNISLTLSIPSVTEDNRPDNPFILYPNYPNPFSISTNIKYYLPLRSTVSIKVYNVFGKLLREFPDINQMHGDYSTEYRFDKLEPGIYYYSVEVSPSDGSARYRETRRMLKIR